MRCPACSDLGAYVGLSTVECPNPTCRFSGYGTAMEHKPLNATSMEQAVLASLRTIHSDVEFSDVTSTVEGGTLEYDGDVRELESHLHGDACRASSWASTF